MKCNISNLLPITFSSHLCHLYKADTAIGILPCSESITLIAAYQANHALGGEDWYCTAQRKLGNGCQILDSVRPDAETLRNGPGFTMTPLYISDPYKMFRKDYPDWLSWCLGCGKDGFISLISLLKDQGQNICPCKNRCTLDCPSKQTLRLIYAGILHVVGGMHAIINRNTNNVSNVAQAAVMHLNHIEITEAIAFMWLLATPKLFGVFLFCVSVSYTSNSLTSNWIICLHCCPKSSMLKTIRAG